MCEPGFIFTIIARLCARRHPAASGRANPIGDTMSSHIATSPSSARRRPRGRVAAALIAFVVPSRAGRRAAGWRRHCRGARLRLRLQRVRRRRPRKSAGAGSWRPCLLRILERRSDQNYIGSTSAFFGEYRQGHQYPMVQCRLGIHVQPAMGRDGEGADDRSHADHGN